MSRFTFLGTCAADFSPRLCGNCKDRFDRDARRASCALIDEKHLIDCGPHCPDSFRISGSDPSLVTDILLTHLHPDHFIKESVRFIAADHTVRLWVREDASVPQTDNVTVMRMKSYERYSLDGETYVTGLPANHDAASFPQHLLIEVGGKKIFYGMDGGWLLFDTYQRLKKQKLDLLILDCTVGDYVGDQRLAEHNSLPMIRVMLPSLKTVGAIDDHTVIYIDHLAVTLHRSHEKTVEICQKDGIHVAYDGLVIHSPEWLE